MTPLPPAFMSFSCEVQLLEKFAGEDKFEADIIGYFMLEDSYHLSDEMDPRKPPEGSSVPIRYLAMKCGVDIKARFTKQTRIFI